MRHRRVRHGPSIATLTETEIIREFARGFPRQTAALRCGVGDDAAVLKIGNQTWLVTTDSLQEGIHFEARWAPWDHVGAKALQVNLSDIAAMGGIPRYYWLTVSLPRNFLQRDLKAMAAGLRRAARAAGVICAGGDTDHSRRDVIMSVTVWGQAPDRIAYRSGARVGDNLYVTGRLGEAGLGLVLLKKGRVVGRLARHCARRQTAPQARLAAGQKLTASGLVHAMIDVSDGLARDLATLMAASRTGAEIFLENLRSPPAWLRLCEAQGLKAWDLILGAGEDYELLFAASPRQATRLQSLAKRLRLPITKIGKVTAGRRLVFRNAHGHPVTLAARGYEHFRR